MVQVASEADRERIREVVRDVVYPADRAFLDALRGDYLARQPRGAGPLVGAQRRRQLYRTADPQPGPRSTSTRRRSTRSASTSSSRSRPSGATIARAAGLRRRHRRLPGRARRRPRQHARRRRPSWSPGPTRGHRAGDGARAALLRRPAAGRAARSAPVEEYKEQDAPFAYYYPPAPDGSRPGIYYANGYDLPSRKYTKLATTTYHEAVPGHHFQIALEMENPHLNTFRRLGARMVGGAYVEGWGLYSERLADEMGLFRDEARALRDARRAGLARRPPGRRHRAPRPALAAPALDRLPARRPACRETDAVIETDRYICWPGQALTYKIGQREIERAAGASSRRATGRRSTCARSTTPCSATARCRWRRSAASSRPGWPRRS